MTAPHGFPLVAEVLEGYGITSVVLQTATTYPGTPQKINARNGTTYEFYDDYVVNESDKDYVELPGYSDHHTGLAFDVKIYDKDGASFSYGRYATEKVAWIVENYKYYGFIMRYPANKGNITGIDGESNHFRYVGLPHSVYITENNMCLEEYLNLIKNHTYDDPLNLTVDDYEYSVWYCKDTVYVPRDGDYTVSSDNLGGFIVTYRK